MKHRARFVTMSLAFALAAGAHAQCPVEFADPTNTGAGGVSVAVGDVNGDGSLDVAGISQVDGTVRLARGNGDGTFQASTIIATLGGLCCGASVRLVDVTGDGRPDLIAVRRGADVAVMVNDGTGLFAEPTYYDLPADITDTPAFDVGPIKFDGTLGIVVPTVDGVGVLTSNGDGTFTGPVMFGSGQGINIRVAAILDARSIGTLAIVVNSGTGRLFNGDGSGDFELSSENYNWGNGERGMVVADMNSDGVPDIVREQVPAGVSVSLYQGNGQFSAEPTFGFGDSWYLKAADFNRDGLTDILSVAFGAGNVRVYIGNGDGTLAEPVEFAPGALEPAVGDMNGDLLPDILTTGGLRLQTPASPVLDPLAAAPALNGSVRAILPYLEQDNLVPSEQTIVAGAFSKFGVAPVSRIATYDGATFTQMGEGLNGTVNALTHHDLDAGGINPTEIIAGGAFTKSGLTKLFKVAAFDGKFWHPLGDAPIVPQAAKDGEGAAVVGWGAAGLVCQQRLLPGDLPSLRPGDVILGFALRVEGGLPAFPTAEKTWPRFDVALGKGVDVMSNTFAANFIGKPTRVRTGPLVMPAGAMPGGASPNQFGQYILFDKPFTYKGGNLLIETRSQSTGEALVADTFQPPETTGELRNFVDNVNASGADGLVSNNGGSRSWAIKLLTVPGPASGFNGNVNALVSGVFAGQTARGADPVLVAGGAFSKSGTTAVNRVAMWDGDKWIPIGAGFNGAVNALLIADLDGNGPNGPVLVAGGAFTKSGANALNRIAFFDGAQWQPVGPGFNGAVNALALHTFADGGEQLVAGGAFTKSGLTILNRIARFDGQGWQPIGDGFKGTVNTLFSDGLVDTGARALFAGGAFTKSGLNIVNRLAVLQGNAWAQLGDGAASIVRALARTDNAHSALGPHLKVGGDFKKTGVLVQPFVTAFGCPSDVLRAARAALPPGVVPPCSIADLAGGGRDGDRPDGRVTLDDAIAFIAIIGAYEPAVLDDLDDAIDAVDDDGEAGKPDDLTDTPEGETTLTDDVIAFVQAYLDGCP